MTLRKGALLLMPGAEKPQTTGTWAEEMMTLKARKNSKVNKPQSMRLLQLSLKNAMSKMTISDSFNKSRGATKSLNKRSLLKTSLKGLIRSTITLVFISSCCSTDSRVTL